jgi:polyhydroxybutyrate depolymerase
MVIETARLLRTMIRIRPPAIATLLLLGTTSVVSAASAVYLPDAYCDAGRIFVHGFEAAWPTDPSQGSGGPYPGHQTRSVFVPETNSMRSYYLHVPASYQPGRPHPLLIVLHGATGSLNTTPAAAQAMRNLFETYTGPGGAIVMALPASGNQGGWQPASDGPFIGAALDDVEADYAIERARRYLWGFSAGAHFGYGIALFNTDVFAAHAVKAGALEAYAGANAPALADRVLPVDIRIGVDDPLLPFAQADRQRFLDAGWLLDVDLTYAEVSGDHEINPVDAQAAWANLCRWALAP